MKPFELKNRNRFANEFQKNPKIQESEEPIKITNFLLLAEFPRAPNRRSSVAPSLGGPPDRADGNEARPSPEASRPAGSEAGRLHGLFALCTLPSDTSPSTECGRGRGSRVAAATPAATAAATVAWKAAKQHGKLTNNGGDSSGPGGRAHALYGPEQGPQDRTARITSHTTFDDEKESFTYNCICIEYLEKNDSDGSTVSEPTFHIAALYLDAWVGRIEIPVKRCDTKLVTVKQGKITRADDRSAPRGLAFLSWFRLELEVSRELKEYSSLESEFQAPFVSVVPSDDLTIFATV
ncbi:hypothetical protein WN48_06116 [Eufriesea mexicana]|nr:hypothetical protein WN48_06116 [Eufriesea mexicana]